MGANVARAGAASIAVGAKWPGLRVHGGDPRGESVEVRGESAAVCGGSGGMDESCVGTRVDCDYESVDEGGARDPSIDAQEPRDAAREQRIGTRARSDATRRPRQRALGTSAASRVRCERSCERCARFDAGAPRERLIELSR